MTSENYESLILPSGYRDNSSLKVDSKPFFHSKLKNTLEKVIGNFEQGEEKGTLENILSDKTKTLKATVKALLDEIELRERLNSHLLKGINDDVCRQHTLMMQFGNQNSCYQSEKFIEINNQKTQFENNVLELEKEKRKEYLECWRDLMFLKKYLLSAFREFWDLVKRREVLGKEVFGAR